MKHTLHLLTLLFCISYGVSAPYTDGEDVNIVGGFVAKEGQFPYQVSIRYRSGAHHCGGSIIDNRHVLSAAHCCEDMTNYLESFYIVAGVTKLFDTRRMVKKEIDSIKMHEQFNKISLQNDICLIKIKGSFSFNNMVKPIELNQARAVEGTRCVASGWGLVNYNKELEIAERTDVLQATIVPISNQKQCDAAFGNAGSINPDSMLCAGGEGTSTCMGDSGGPLVCNNKLTGVVSFGAACAFLGVPDVYARVDRYVPWINQSKRQLSYKQMDYNDTSMMM